MEMYKQLIIALIEKADDEEKIKIIYRFIKRYLG